VVPTIDHRFRHRGKVVDRRQQASEHAFADRLRAEVGIAVGKRITFSFVPRHGRVHGTKQHGRIVAAERGIGRRDGLEW